MRTIEVTGARQNNLQDVDVNIPGDRLTVVTGVSGSYLGWVLPLPWVRIY
jgi:excinuclease UvrABC ATPase subunit